MCPAAWLRGWVGINARRIVSKGGEGPLRPGQAPGRPGLVAALRQHGKLDIEGATAALLCAMSAATIDRRVADLCGILLAGVRRKTVIRRAQTSAVYRSKT